MSVSLREKIIEKVVQSGRDSTFPYNVPAYADQILSLIGKCGNDNKFIAHIQSHLPEGQEVICKICGKTAKEICND